MVNRIYLKLVRYFIVLIVFTCFASMALFFFTAGYPLMKDFHRLLRKQALYAGYLAGDYIDKGSSREELGKFLKKTSESYETQMAIFGSDRVLITGTKDFGKIDFSITDGMIEKIKSKGLYVQPSHVEGKPLIYVLPVSKEKNYYLVLYKSFGDLKMSLVFTGGLIVLFFILVLAIYPLSKGFTKPLNQVTEAIKRISEGDFKDIPEAGKRKDELGDLLRVFNDMSRSVDTMIESRKKLLADISHELRSPLGRLFIAAELIKGEKISEDMKVYVDNIEFEIELMDNLLKKLSEYSVLNLPNPSIKDEPVNFSKLLTDIKKRYQHLMEKKNINFEVESSIYDHMIDGDISLIIQLITNLTDNAVNACEPGGRIKIRSEIRNGRTFVSIENTGPEIPDKYREKIFEPLFRVDTSRSRKTGGLGLGLAIAGKIVDLHNGEIGLRCEGGITTFFFSI